MSLSPTLLRERRSGVDPLSIAGLALWLDASNAGSLTLNGSGVSEWRDLSGGGAHFSQATAARQPNGTSRSLGGRRVIDFDGTQCLNGNATAAGISRNTPALTLIVAAKVDSTVSDAARVFALHVGVAGLGARATLFLAGQTYTLRSRRLDDALAFADVTYAAAGSATDENVFSGVIDYANTDCALYAGGILRGSDANFLDAGNSADTDSASTTLGAFDSSLTQPLDGCIGEMLVYRRALPDVERQKLEQYLIAKWGIS